MKIKNFFFKFINTLKNPLFSLLWRSSKAARLASIWMLYNSKWIPSFKTSEEALEHFKLKKFTL